MALLDEGRVATTLWVNHMCTTCRRKLWSPRGACVANPLATMGTELSYTYRGRWALLFETTLQKVEPESKLEGLVEAEAKEFVGNITEE